MFPKHRQELETAETMKHWSFLSGPAGGVRAPAREDAR
jgi:hypothetical protein